LHIRLALIMNLLFIKKSRTMKKLLFLLPVYLLFTGGTAWGGNEKTIANLKAAYKGESTASAKYAAYAQKAKEEGFPQIAVLFNAASKAENIHAQNHKAVLVKLGVTPDAVKPEFTVKTTTENLKDAQAGETEEFTAMYPGYIAIAKDENVMDAVRSFSWAMDTEKKHKEFYAAALGALSAKNLASLPKFYWVCPKCGNTFSEDKPAANCPFCYTSKEKYIKIS
jgi:rubrerythrin